MTLKLLRFVGYLHTIPLSSLLHSSFTLSDITFLTRSHFAHINNNIMIVAFARRRSSDGSHSQSHSNVVRKSERRAVGSMIVTFDDRTPSNVVRKSDRHTIGSSRRTKGGTSRKQTSPVPTDPPAVSWRQLDILSNRKARSRKENEAKNDSPTRYSRSGVIVEFPEWKPQDHAMRRSDSKKMLSLSGIFGKHEGQRDSHTSSSRSKQQPKKHNSSTRNHQDRHARKFKDAVDWRNTSIDWGDEDEANITDDDAKLETLIRPDPSGHKRSQRNTEFTDSDKSLLSQSHASLLSIRKLDS